MSDQPTPETDQQAIRMETAKLAGAESVVTAEHARHLERQRDAYAETLRHLCAFCHEKGGGLVITDRHPELAP